MGSFVRFQSPTRDSELGINIGVFGLVNMLYNRGRLTDADVAERRRRLDWFNDAFADPTESDPTAFVANPSAVSWFKSDASAHLIGGMRQHCDILDRYSVEWERVESLNPGRIVFEDSHQVLAVPFREFIVQGAYEVDVEALDA